MYFYHYQDNIFFSHKEYPQLLKTDQQRAMEATGKLYFLKELDPLTSRRSYCVSNPNQLFQGVEDLSLLLDEESHYPIPDWLNTKIEAREVMSVNTAYANWHDVINRKAPEKWKVNIAGLGDVGSTLLIGLRLLGGDCIQSIGIYDRDANKLSRWQQEINQIYQYGSNENQPEVRSIAYEEVFDCDLFIFCIAARVPPIGEEAVDVRMVQFEQNSKIINTYGQLARDKGFKGIFAVVSDPVDLLCKSLLIASNTSINGIRDFKGLAPEQIRGYGLGVMNARALYYANQSDEATHFEREGRSFGPHGEGLIIADSIDNYNHELSLYLTDKAKNANIEVRQTGFKPYVAPALSSGALSILSTIRGEWHYSATFMGGIYMGALNRLNSTGTEVEAYKMSATLFDRLKETYKQLELII
ncbi:lactate/malate family dehydrogenase [Alkaliphilus peptidifermentans]|uniref:Malate/lactate dehydrogenase n=1 Tax=Alkaliphilus peptidifermentans DSM 18978 TaxID=1120976 RepID=A0A1G5GJ25_9FIRM|nr:lactate dehydrogenase [Alkaliphilus peptidifermentans]SCY51504.1 Malate/lactate dehydrogenase [Alkaliphilus peptidifermentans DSM 18978]